MDSRIIDVIQDIRDNKVIFLGESKLRNRTKWFTKVPYSGSFSYCKYSTTKIYYEISNPIDKFKSRRDVEYFGILVNFASSSIPGNNEKVEEIYTRSNLIYSLYSFTELGKLFNFMSESKDKYPLESLNFIYSPKVSIYRNSNLLRTNQFNCNIITTLSLKYVNINLHKETIRQLFRLCIYKRKCRIVIPADWVFSDVNCYYSNLYYEILNESEFINSFSEICFTINPLRQNEMMFIDKFEQYIN